MSGSSLDGVDMALCEFKYENDKTEWQIIKAETITYSNDWIKKLKSLPVGSSRDIAISDFQIGYLFGDMINGFLGNENIDFIASHGHTLFHFPELATTCQIGNGAAIASRTGVSTICDFRSMDMGFGGQGAPLASIADRYLFSEFDALVNLGGISNISFNYPDKTIAYDISPCNQLLNHLVSELNIEYDKDGHIAKKGRINNSLLGGLLNFGYFALPIPKSLDNNFIKENFFPVLDTAKCSIEDKLATSVELIAKTLIDELIKYKIPNKEPNKVILTGGGAKNTFLVNQIRKKSVNIDILVPDMQIVDFKEALMIAYMGFLRVNGKTNVLYSATGARQDSIGGAVYLV